MHIVPILVLCTYFFYFFPLFLCSIQYMHGNLKQSRGQGGSSLKKLTSAAQAYVVSLFLIPWPDFNASQLSRELRQQEKEVISSRQRGLLQMPVLLSSEKNREFLFIKSNHRGPACCKALSKERRLKNYNCKPCLPADISICMYYFEVILTQENLC